ncbi:MAG: MAB_1171c family putative transporter [Micromonosporaceae bacterium]
MAAALLWLAVIYEAVSLTRQRDNRARRALLLTFVALALAATFFVPSVYVATQDVTGLSNVADLIARCAVLLASLGAQSLLLHLTQEPATATRMSRQRAVAMSAAMVLLVVLFMIAPVHETGTLRLTSDFGNSPWVTGYLLVFSGYLGIALVDVLRGGLRYAPKAGMPVSLALRLIAIGCVFGLLYVAGKLGFLIAVLLGGSPSPEIESAVARTLAVMGGLFVLAGSLTPAVYPRWRRAARWVETYWAHRKLYPLWSALHEIAPEIALDPAASEFRDRLRVRDLDFRLYRRVIEIRDGRMALRPFLDADVARRARDRVLKCGLDDRDVEAAVEASVLTAGVENARRHRRPAEALPASGNGGDDFMAEVEWFLRVAGVPLPADPYALGSSTAPPGRLEVGPA